MRRLVVVGGGIAGLAAAWSARRHAASVPGGLEIEVFERDSEVGGKVRTVARNGWIVECGASGFLSGRPQLDALIHDCGLAAELQPSTAASARRYLYRAGRMREVIPSPLGFARSGILSPLGMTRVAAEPLIPRRRDRGDESVWAFAARRLGREAADRLALPMTLGVFAGDAKKLSLPAAFPVIAALERDHGSLLRALIARRRRAHPGRLTSFRDGMQTLPRALAQSGRFQVKRSAMVRSIARDGARWRIDVAGVREAISADAVIFACEPFASASVIRALDPVAAADLDAIPVPPVAVVSLGFGSEEMEAVPGGFGVLIARSEGYRMLGNLWESNIYDSRAPAHRVLLRAMFGGTLDPEAATLSEQDLLTLARSEIRRLYGIPASPCFEHVVQWSRAIPQYELGHLDRVTRIEQRVSALPGLFLAGSGLYGVSFADAAESGVHSGERVVQWLAKVGEA